jgi:hypothetical protein
VSDVKVYRVPMIVPVLVTITEPDAIDRCVNNADGWRDTFYADLTTRDKVLEMFAYNAIANGVGAVKHLDGWADLRHGGMMKVEKERAELDEIQGAEVVR